MSDDAVALDALLPRDLPRDSVGLAAYRDFPVFSWPWLARRTALVALGSSAFSGLLAVGAFARGTTARDALVMSASFTCGVVAMASAGPLLATLVRYRRWALRVERPLVIAALALGLVVSFVADSLASAAVEASLKLPEEPPVEALANGPVALALNVLVLVVIYGTVGGGLALRSYLDEPRRMRERARDLELAALRAKNESLDTHLGVLQAQIEPHFLFNSLASVRSLIATDPATAAEAIDGLVTYLRATIPRLRGATVESTLGEQVAICRAYLDLMRARLGRLGVVVDAHDDAAAQPFPPLLLMSLVENALRHGIEPKVGHGTVTLRAHHLDGALVVAVEDDGVGFRDGVGRGVGLSNARATLLARYDERASLTLSARPGGGAIATITIREDA